MNYKVIDKINLDKIKQELSTIEYKQTYTLQGKNKEDNPFQYIISADESTNAWERSPKDRKAEDLIVSLFDVPYINSLLDKFQIGYGRVCMLGSKTCYTYHKDISKRIHIPIETNDKCFFVLDDEILRLPADGSVYEIDTTKIHTFVNGSTSTRTHIVGTLLANS